MPKEREVPLDAEPSPDKPVAFTGEQFDRLVDAIRGNQTDRVAAEAEIHALAMRKQLHPSNETTPAVSIFNPLGERDHPRPDLVCEMFIGPYPLEKQTLLAREIELLNKLQPGTYDVTKSDGTQIAFHVLPKYRIDGKSVERLTLMFPCGDDQKQNFPSLVAMLSEVIDQQEVRSLTTGVR